MDNNLSKIPKPTIRRIPSYLRILNEYKDEGKEWISATDIANRLSLKSIQVRKDMAFTDIIGKPKKGYKVEELIEAVKRFLGWSERVDAVLVGSGALGAALLGYGGFKDNGLNIIEAFDSNPVKIGTTIHGRKVRNLADLKETLKKYPVEIGIITVPAESAQKVADTMIDAGIKAIWNFAPVKLNVPDYIIVEREDLSAGLAVLSVQLQFNKTSHLLLN